MNRSQQSQFWPGSRSLVATLAALSLAGCAASAPQLEPVPLVPASATQAPQPSWTVVDPASPREQTAIQVLPPSERDLSCRRIKGRMQMRILQVRGRLQDQPKGTLEMLTSAIALSTRMILSGFADTADKSDTALNASDLAQLRGYNALLASKGCETLDLDAELRAPPLRPVSHVN